MFLQKFDITDNGAGNSAFSGYSKFWPSIVFS